MYNGTRISIYPDFSPELQKKDQVCGDQKETATSESYACHAVPDVAAYNSPW